MKISRASKRLASIVLSVIMLVSIISIGFVSSAASTLTGSYTVATKVVNVSSADGIADGGGGMYVWAGDQVATVSSSTYSTASGIGGKLVFGWGASGYLTWSSNHNSGSKTFTFTDAPTGTTGVTVATYDPWGDLVGVGFIGQLGDPVSIYQGTTKLADGSNAGAYSIGIEEGSVDFRYDSTRSVTWSLDSNSVGGVLSSTTAATTKLSFDKTGTVVLVAKSDQGVEAKVNVTVHNNNIELKAFAYAIGNDPITNNKEFTLEQGSSMEVSVECSDPSKLAVAVTSGSSASFTQGAADPVPVTITGNSIGTTTFSLSLYGKTLTFKVNVIEPTAAKFFVGAEQIGLLVSVAAGESINVTCNLNVDRWALGGTSAGVNVAKVGAKECKIDGITSGSIATIEAYDTANNLIGWFDVFVSDGNPYFAEIIYSSDFTKVGASYTFDGIGDSESFAAHCSIIVGSTDVVWSLIPAKDSTGTVSCATLDTSATDANGNKIAVVTAVSEGSCVLKLSANGIDAYLNIVIGEPITEYTDLVFKTLSYQTLLLPGFPNGVNVYENQKVLLAEGNGRTMIPFRFLGEAMGATVNYYESTKTVEYILDGKTVTMSIDDPHITINGAVLALPDYEYEPARQYENDNGELRTYVHVRLIADAFGLNCKYLPISENDEGIEIGYIVITNNMNADEAYFQNLSDKARNVLGA